MSNAISHLPTLLASMEPNLEPRAVAYLLLEDAAQLATTVPAAAVIGTFREREGLTVICELDAAERAGVPILFRAAWITLAVHSDLAAVGLTAAFAGALGAAGISCNVVAAAFHDHLFVAREDAARALHVLRDLQRQAGGA